jgi:hypothetical protein
MMSRSDNHISFRAPKGWNQFSGLRVPSAGQAIAKDISRARIFGLQYRIEGMPIFKNDMRLLRYDFHIEGWEYSILNESTEYPVLSFSLMDRFDPALPRESFITDIRSYASVLPRTRYSAMRAIGAAMFFIRHINEGKVPDVNRALRSYKLHPNQAYLYRHDELPEPDVTTAFNESRAGARDYLKA